MDIQDEVDNLETQQKETEDLKWRIFKLEVQLEQDTAHYRQRAETAEAERDALRELLNDRTNDVEHEYARAEAAEARVTELERELWDCKQSLTPPCKPDVDAYYKE